MDVLPFDPAELPQPCEEDLNKRILVRTNYTENLLWLLCTAAASPSAREALRATGVEVIEVAADEHGRVDVAAAARELGRRRLHRVLVEGGGEVAAALLRSSLIDRVTSYQAGFFLGADSRSAMAALGLENLGFAARFSLVSSRVVGGDVVETWHRGA